MSGNTEEVGWLLYTSYLIPFEIASMLLLVISANLVQFITGGPLRTVRILMLG